MQRRRRKKAAPKNVFGTGSQVSRSVKKSPKTKPATLQKRAPKRAPPSVPGAKPKPTPKQSEPVLPKGQPLDPETEATSKDVQVEEIPPELEIKEEVTEDLIEEIVEKQIIGTKKKNKQVPKSPESNTIQPDQHASS